MGNLGSSQLEAILAGQPVAQRWTLSVPLDAQHSYFYDTVIDSGVFNGGAVAQTDASKRRVTRAGSRTHEVWNPSPQDADTPNAVRYTFEVGNEDGYFFQGGSGTAWNPFGLYSARPQECRVTHQLFVWSVTQNAWQEITHMKFVGEIKEVTYDGAFSMTTDTNGNRAACPATATITCEQIGAQSALRVRFTEDDADIEETNSSLRRNL